MSAPRNTRDIFITHAWRYHDDWTRMSDLLDRYPGLSWRNFSVPWYDPAMDPNTEVGGKFIRRWLESQIIPAVAVILLGGVYAVNSSRKWVEMEVDMARRHLKPVIGAPAFGSNDMAADAHALVDVVVSWDAAEIVAAIDRLAASTATEKTADDSK